MDGRIIFEVRAAALSVPMGGSFSGMTHFSAAQRRFGVAYSQIDEVAARGSKSPVLSKSQGVPETPLQLVAEVSQVAPTPEATNWGFDFMVVGTFCLISGGKYFGRSQDSTADKKEMPIKFWQFVYMATCPSPSRDVAAASL
jgi:hypothetical protein